MKMSSPRKQRRRGGRRSTRKGKILNDSNSSSPLPSAAASFIGSSIDILPLILTRLPSKSLLVFKCVSKQWLSIITHPKFVHKHFILQNPKFSIPGLFWGSELSSTTEPPYGCMLLDGNANNQIPFDFKIGKLVREGITIVQSCNGLLLCSDCECRKSDRTYYVFNPFTKQYKVFPPFQMKNFTYLRNVSLAFDPLKSSYYKVIYFWRNRDLKYRIEIYDSETSWWRLSGFDSCSLPAEAEAILWAPSIFWNGSLYWCDWKGVISYFDVDHELVGVVPLPTPVHTNRDTTAFRIAEFGGRFYLMKKNLSRFNVFELNSADCWKVKGHVNARLYARSPRGSTFLLVDRIIFITEREGEEDSTKVVLLTEEGRVVTYDLKDMRIEKIHDLSAQRQFDASVQFHQYIESLACVESPR